MRHTSIQYYSVFIGGTKKSRRIISSKRTRTLGFRTLHGPEHRVSQIMVIITPTSYLRGPHPPDPLPSPHRPAIKIIILDKRRRDLNPIHTIPLNLPLQRREVRRHSPLHKHRLVRAPRHARVKQPDHIVARAPVRKCGLVGHVPERLDGVVRTTRRRRRRESGYLDFGEVAGCPASGSEGRGGCSSSAGVVVVESSVRVARRLEFCGRDFGPVGP